jgi:peroxiredoxin
VTDKARTFPRRWTVFISADGKILHIDKAVKAGSHGADCAAKLAELKVPAAD